jgi:hypothetical protein
MAINNAIWSIVFVLNLLTSIVLSLILASELDLDVFSSGDPALQYMYILPKSLF